MIARKSLLILSGIAALTSAAHSQIFFNGNFETGNFAGWNIANTTNGTSLIQNVVQFDIDGPGTRPTNFAAQFAVGQVNFNPGVPAGITITQQLNLTAGLLYYFDFDWATGGNTSDNTEGGIFSLIVNGNSVATQNAGFILANTFTYGHVTGTFTPTSSGVYTVGARIERPFLPSGLGLRQYVDNFSTTVVPEPASMVALGVGAAGLLARRRRKH
jgi:hypothetical protein